jgi:hypothetical protein
MLLALLARLLAGCHPGHSVPPSAAAAAAAVACGLWPDIEQRLGGKETAALAEEQLQELVYAFGLGFKPPHALPLPALGLLPPAPWVPAVEWAARAALERMWASHRWLRWVIWVGAPASFWQESKPEYGEALSMIMTSATEAACDCHRLQSEDGQVARAVNVARRQQRCSQRHWFGAWRPREVSLRGFIAQMVKGRAGVKDRAFIDGEFVKGMYWVILFRQHGLRHKLTIEWHCRRHDSWQFEGLPCLDCASSDVATAGASPRCWRRGKRWIVLPAERRGCFEEAHYWRCQICPADGDYYLASLAACPRCGHGRTAGAKQSSARVVRLSPSLLAQPREGVILEAEFEELQWAIDRLDPVEKMLIQVMYQEHGSAEEVIERVHRRLGITITPEEIAGLRKKAIENLRRILKTDDFE